MFQILVVVQMFLVVFFIDVIMRLVVVKRGFTCLFLQVRASPTIFAASVGASARQDGHFGEALLVRRQVRAWSDRLKLRHELLIRGLPLPHA